ncbi:MAG: GWxTD domain-containing protein [Candidatus Cyclonatronum sp.]|uniref:GWxTD domain-containing protein n=1 Tax=Cyclonatronum sp. TaxID=3024185 RepID=UPI0025B947D9|nr:GWxTD domain-containing protein [Cyclonatronum sp.]MCH8488033.1 GWxTD domain-containing protein [Cyclonatronum sp.]
MITPIKSVLLGALILLISAPELLAQRNVSYRELASQNRAPGLYIDHTVIKADEGEPNVWLHYRFGYDVLRFRQVSGGAADRFEATAELSIQIFDATGVREPEDIRRGTAIKTLTWRGRAQASGFDETSRADLFLNANLSAQLPAGRYAYATSITLDGRPLQLRRNMRMFTVPDFTEPGSTPVWFAYPAEESSSDRFGLINFGRSVLYAQDFDALLLLPDPERTYSLHVNQVDAATRDTSVIRQVFEAEITPETIRRISRMQISEQSGAQPFLEVDEAETGSTAAASYLAQITIPNRKFENTSFIIQVKDGDTLVAERFFRNLWLDIPTSLLNIDVAIRKMEIIMDRDAHRELRRGNEQQRIANFRAFWQARDPEPESDYNPVMVEFFRRVDIAFERFTTPNQPGYDSDQGRTLIRFGEPDRITRRLPAGSPAVEVWQYSDREFIFEATSGFGEYRLLRSNRL